MRNPAFMQSKTTAEMLRARLFEIEQRLTQSRGIRAVLEYRRDFIKSQLQK